MVEIEWPLLYVGDVVFMKMGGVLATLTHVLTCWLYFLGFRCVRDVFL